MLNTKQLRAMRQNGEFDTHTPDKFKYKPLIIGISLLLCFIGIISCSHAATITDTQAVRAILGEGESEPFIGKVALGETIRARGSMKGIYGYNAIKYVNGKYYRDKRAISSRIASEALKAWQMSKSTNYSRNAQGWGNASDLVIFKSQSWFNKCYITVKIGNHYFWGVRNG